MWHCIYMLYAIVNAVTLPFHFHYCRLQSVLPCIAVVRWRRTIHTHRYTYTTTSYSPELVSTCLAPTTVRLHCRAPWDEEGAKPRNSREGCHLADMRVRCLSGALRPAGSMRLQCSILLPRIAYASCKRCIHKLSQVLQYASGYYVFMCLLFESSLTIDSLLSSCPQLTSFLVRTRLDLVSSPSTRTYPYTTTSRPQSCANHGQFQMRVCCVCVNADPNQIEFEFIFNFSALLYSASEYSMFFT